MGVAQGGSQAVTLQDRAVSPPATYGDLAAYFEPRSVAVVGASEDTSKFGGRVLAYLSSGKWEGRVVPVHPRLQQVQGLRAAPDLARIDIGVDLAVIAAPQAAVEEALEQCVATGVRAAVVFASGYAEAGEAGRLQQQSLVTRAALGRLRILGPNCIGVVNARNRFAATFATMWQDGWDQAGAISVVSQSGAMASYFFVMLRERGLGIATWCSTGNEGDVDVAECIVYAARDPGTRVVLAALEGVAHGARLISALHEARAAGKPVILLKVGRSQVGRAAAASHTGALAGEGRIFDAAVRQTGAIVASTVTQAVDVAAAFVTSSLPRGRRLAIVSASGGGGIMAADRAEADELVVPELDAPLRRSLDALLPGGNSRNPVDVTAMVLTDMELMVTPIAQVAASPDIDAVVVFLTSAFRSEAMLDKLIGRLHAHGVHRCGKPVMLTTTTSPQGFARLHAAGFPSYTDPAHAVDAVAMMCGWREHAVASRPDFERPGPVALPCARDEAALLALFGEHGIPVAPCALATSQAQAVALAEQLGPVVAMKVSVPGLAHKSDVGGVMLGIGDERQARDAWDALVSRQQSISPDSTTPPAVIVQRQMRGVVELMLGMRRDPSFGMVIMVGMGGKWVEILDDVAIRIAPVDANEARAMLHELRAAPLLAGARGQPCVDVEAAVRAIVAFSQLAVLAHGVMTAEINPFILGREGEGGWAVDAKLVSMDDAPARRE